MICSQTLVSACLLLWASTTTEAWNPSSKPAFAARHSQQRETPKSKLSTKLGMAAPVNELEYNSDRIRNFSIIAHIDHGAYSYR